jgi:hypothetical protein
MPAVQAGRLWQLPLLPVPHLHKARGQSQTHNQCALPLMQAAPTKAQRSSRVSMACDLTARSPTQPCSAALPWRLDAAWEVLQRTCVLVLVHKVDLHGRPDAVDGVLRGGVEVELQQLQLPVAHLGCVARLEVDLASTPCTVSVTPNRRVKACGKVMGCVGVPAWCRALCS